MSNSDRHCLLQQRWWIDSILQICYKIRIFSKWNVDSLESIQAKVWYTILVLALNPTLSKLIKCRLIEIYNIVFSYYRLLVSKFYFVDLPCSTVPTNCSSFLSTFCRGKTGSITCFCIPRNISRYKFFICTLRKY